MADQTAPAPSDRTNWLRIAALALLVVWLVAIMLSATRSFWYDEVFTLGVSGVNGSFDWATLKRDVHPPTYALMVHALTGLAGDNLFALRLANLPGAIALLAALALLSRQLSPPRLALAAILLLGNFLTLYMSVELRSYFLVLGFSALGQAILLARLRGQLRMDIWLCLVGVVLAALHLFGAALGAAMLGTSALDHLMARRRRRTALALGGAVLCVVVSFGWAFGLADITQRMGGKQWITNSISHYLEFVTTQPLLILTLVLLVAARAGIVAGRQALWMLLPGATVLAVALLISLHTPVVTSRNLIVLVPGLVLAVTIAMPQAMLRRLAATPLTPIIAVLVAGLLARNASADMQHIAWTARQATPPGCDGVPVYVINPDSIDSVAQRVFVGSVKRPVRDILDLRMGFDPGLYGTSCPVLAMGWHELGGTDNVDAFLDALDIPHSVIFPNESLAQTARATHGFVVLHRPD